MPCYIVPVQVHLRDHLPAAAADGALPGPHLLPGGRGERARALPEGARQERQDARGEDDGGGGQDDELHGAAEARHQGAAGQTLPGGRHLQTQGHRGH